MRQFLLIKLHCSVCETILEFDYDSITRGVDYCVGQPTGADMVGRSFGVIPCSGCAAKHKKFLDALDTVREALKVGEP